MTGWIVLLLYILLFAGAFVLINFVRRMSAKTSDYTSLKTVTFGDESAIRPDRAASILSVLVIFLIWGAFTGSKWAPFHVPGPYSGTTEFTYTATAADGTTDDATVRVVVHGPDEDTPAVEDDYNVTAVDGQPIAPGETVKVNDGTVTMTAKGSLSFEPAKGLQMEPIWMPSPEAVVSRFIEIASSGYQNFTLWQHLGWSLFRVLLGFACGALLGIPLGYAMGLSGWFRGWFDPIVEFMRPVPPLALIPLVIIWFGIWETGKIVLLFLAALWVMTIAARAGVSGVNITKVHAAYSLGASKSQVLRYVIVPNSLPEIFTGARVAMGVCWGTVVAAELVAAQKGAGMMIIAASKFQLTDIVLMGIILIGIIGYGIDILMRMAEKVLVPWKGQS